MKLLDSETVADNFGRRSDRRRAAERARRGWILCGLSLLLAFIGAGFALLLSGSLVRERGPDGTAAHTVDAGPPSLPEAAPLFDAQALRDQLEEIAEGYEGVYGAAVLEPASGTKVSLQGDEEFMVASIGKLPVLATLYRAGTRGELDFEEEIPVLPGDVQDYGNGELLTFPVDYSLSLREYAYRLVKHSDNIAWAVLNRRLGEDKIRAELENMGIKNSRYSDRLSGYFTTPNDVLLLLEKISDPQFTSEKLSAEMLDAMTETTLEDRIPERLPPDVRVAHKTGSYGDNFGDAGIVFYRDSQGAEKRYYLVVLAKRTGEDQARDAIQKMSLAVYEALTGTKVDPGWSRMEQTLRERGVDNWRSTSPAAPLADGKPTLHESGAGNPPESRPSSAEKAEGHGESMKPAKSPLDEKLLSENQYKAGDDLPLESAPPLAPAVREPVGPEAFEPAFPQEIIDEEEQ